MDKQNFLLLLSKKLSGEIGIDEAAQLQQAIQQHEAYQNISDQMTLYFESADATKEPPLAQLNKVWEAIYQASGSDTFVFKYKDQAPEKKKFFSSVIFKAAAALLIIAGVAFATYSVFKEEQNTGLITIRTSGGKLFKTLDDGTNVWLNRGSVLKYNPGFGKTKRLVFLEGEAFFDVVKNSSVPLYIHTGEINIEVKGTAFNVNSYQKSAEIEVSLIRGLIEVSSTKDQDRKVLLRPNQKLSFDRRNTIQGQSFHIVSLPAEFQRQTTKWTQDSLIFKKEKLKDLALQLEKKYKVKITILNDELKEKRFSGMFTAEGLNEALEALKISFPFKYKITGQLVIIQ